MFSFHFCSPLLGTVKDGLLTIGNISAPVYSPDEKMKVPDVLFYENVQVRSLSAYYLKKHCPLLCGPQTRERKIWVHQAQSLKPQELLYSFKEIVQQKRRILSSFFKPLWLSLLMNFQFLGSIPKHYCVVGCFTTKMTPLRRLAVIRC